VAGEPDGDAPADGEASAEAEVAGLPDGEAEVSGDGDGGSVGGRVFDGAGVYSVAQV
jgi:hypothetical protein